MDYYKNFDWLFSDTAEEYIKKKEQERSEKEKKRKKHIKKLEEAGVCENCGHKGRIRWVYDGEFYSCYECFIHDLQCMSEIDHHCNSSDEYMSETNWNDICEEDE